jgi:hypothetical protein
MEGIMDTKEEPLYVIAGQHNLESSTTSKVTLLL